MQTVYHMTCTPMLVACILMHGMSMNRWKFISGDNMLWSQLDLSPFARRLHDDALMSYITRFGTHVQTLKLCQSKRISSSSLTM